MRLFTLCSYLKTKESYDRWVTRRLWEFRQQISKAKYLKMSVGNIRKLQENTAALYTERKLSGQALSEDPDMSDQTEFWMCCPEKVKRRPDKILPPGGMSYVARGTVCMCKV